MIRLNDAHFLFESRGIAGIHKLNLNINQGEVVSILGPSGAGKTTLLNIISKKIPLESGSVDVQADSNQISYVKQFPQLDEDKTLFENLIDSSNQQFQSEMRKSLELLELTNEVDLPVKVLSGGQKQRAIIAKALTPWPKILLLDEPFANIHDFLKFDLLNFLIPKFKETNTTCIWVTHHVKDALAFSDKMALMNFGNIVQFSNPQDLYKKPNGLFAGNFLGPINTWSMPKSAEFRTQFLNEEVKTSIENSQYEIFCLLRPENITLTTDGVKVSKVESFYQGIFWENHGVIGNDGEQVIFYSKDKPESQCSLQIDWQKAHFLDGIS